jgi:hypothetical protein
MLKNLTNMIKFESYNKEKYYRSCVGVYDSEYIIN